MHVCILLLILLVSALLILLSIDLYKIEVEKYYKKIKRSI